MRDVKPTRRAIIIASGRGDGPAQALRDRLLDHGVHITVVTHPLLPEHGRIHTVEILAPGEEPVIRRRRVPARPIHSYWLDPLVPLRLPRADVFFGFNPVATARGLGERSLGRSGKVVAWSVDMVPNRFGRGMLTRIYDSFDRRGAISADVHVELSETASHERGHRHRLDSAARTNVRVVPMGAWLGRTPTTTTSSFANSTIVYLGHLVSRQGVDLLLDSIAIARRSHTGLSLDIIGRGEEESSLRAQATALGLNDIVRFHGFVSDHREVERLLATCAVAVAPYRDDAESFSRFADPGKLKAYLAAGLPIVLTDVPPNAAELARAAGARLVTDDARGLAEGILDVLQGKDGWDLRRTAALAYIQAFDWPRLLDPLLTDLGLADIHSG